MSADCGSITGSVVVTPQVVATVVTTSVMSVPAVFAMAHVPGHGIPFFSGATETHGVRLVINGNAVSVEVYIIIAHGVNAITTGASIQDAVAHDVQHLLGMDVTKVSTYIRGIQP